MANRYADWLKQAEADFKHGKNSLNSEDYEWSCFSFQQAAEKAIKALFLKSGRDAWGHTLTILLGKLPETIQISEETIECAKILDKHYIPTRYPNGFDEGAPTDFYTRKEAEEALRCGGIIIEFCKNHIHRPE